MAELTDKLVGAGEKPELSPNPDGSGYVKQVRVNDYSTDAILVPQENVLYILLDGRQFKYLSDAGGRWVRVENGPDQLKEEGPRGKPVKENVAPRKAPQIFRDPVAFQDEVYIKGKKLEDYIDSQGGVTEEELQVALQTKQDTLVGSGEGQNIKTVNNQSLVGSGNITIDELDSDVTVEISTNGGSTYANPIPLKTFIANCESGDVYTNVGTIARINHCINGASFRFILIGLNHDILANTDAGELEPSGTAAKTTWQFYDIPVQKVNLGVPYDVQDFDTVEGFVGGDDYYAYPSNKHGYSSATGLLDALHCLFESLPLTLQKSMKLVRKDCYIPRINHTDDIDDIRDNSTADFIRTESDRYGSCISQKLFCLSAAEVGATDGTIWPLTVTINEGEENEQEVNLEGHKYAYFETGNEGTALTKRIRYYGGDSYYYWLRSPSLTYSSIWGYVNGGGGVNDYNSTDGSGLAPAFCI